MLSLGRSDPTVHFAGRLPTKEASHLPINKPNNPVIVNYAIGLGEVVVHETHVRVSVGVREEDISFQGMDTAIAQDVGILDDVGASPATIRGLYYVELSKYLSCLLFECFLLALR